MRNPAFALVVCLIAACAAEPPSSADEEAREQAFEESMRQAALVGQFTLVPLNEDGTLGQGDGDVKLRTERYEIDRVVKRTGDLWTFHARIQFADTDITVPVPVRLTWSGDTPVVGVTDLGLPGLGRYTARVVFYRDAYAGMWWGGSHGGHLFGRIERPD